MHLLTMLLFTTIILSQPILKRVLPSDLNNSHLATGQEADPVSHAFCAPPSGFTIGYQHCTFASAILSSSLNSSRNGTLANAWIFSPLCDVWGAAQNIQVNELVGGKYNFDSNLKYVAVTDFGDGRLGTGSPKVAYAGKNFGGDVKGCWWMDQDDVGSIWGCVFDFNC